MQMESEFTRTRLEENKSLKRRKIYEYTEFSQNSSLFFFLRYFIILNVDFLQISNERS